MDQKRRDYDESIEILSAGVSCFPDNARLNICLAVSHMNLGNFKKALTFLLPFQQSGEALQLIAGCYQALNEPEKAAAFMAKRADL